MQQRKCHPSTKSIDSPRVLEWSRVDHSNRAPSRVRTRKAGRSYTESTYTDNVAKKNQTKSSPIQGGADPDFAGSAPQINQERKKQLKDDLAAMVSNWRMEDDRYHNDLTDPCAKPRRAGTDESSPYEP